MVRKYVCVCYWLWLSSGSPFPLPPSLPPSLYFFYCHTLNSSIPPISYRGAKRFGVLLRGQGGDLQMLPHSGHQLGCADDLWTKQRKSSVVCSTDNGQSM